MRTQLFSTGSVDEMCGAFKGVGGCKEVGLIGCLG